jgi:glycosyltransferase involved in cell wall biosynthesis
VDGRNILVRDGASEFADGVEAVIHQPDLAARLAAEGRRTAEEVYSWGVIRRRVSKLYGEIAGEPPLGIDV